MTRSESPPSGRKAEPRFRPAPDSRRATQSLVHTLSYCWSRPALLGIELAWRWLFGVPMLLLLGVMGMRIFSPSALASTGVYDISMADPSRAALVLGEAERVLIGPMLDAARWLAPLLAVLWAIASGIGRNVVLRNYDASLPFWPMTLVALQLLRIAALGGSFAGWFLALRWAARVALGAGTGDSDVEPNLVLYLALLIGISLGIFTLWALLSWVFSIAPLVALAERQSIAGSLARSLRLGRLSGRLAEVNLVLGIVKLALIVLAMVFSATPLPFANALGGTALYLWWGVVTVLYFVASDFFQIARLIAFLDLLRLYPPALTA
ncbi:MAG TPA: hypothetical protein VGD59_15635 [Acidisarcina sp.]